MPMNIGFVTLMYNWAIRLRPSSQLKDFGISRLEMIQSLRKVESLEEIFGTITSKELDQDPQLCR